MTAFDSASAAAHALARCSSCGRVGSMENRHCLRCQAPLHLRKPHSLQRTMALTIGAAILYFPANLLSVLQVESTLTGSRHSTILSGVAQFWQEGDYPVAMIIFIASVLIPTLKFLALLILCLGIRFGYSPRQLTKLYRVIEYIGRWSMVDVFVVAILVGVVQLGSVMTINPGEGAFAFAGMVVLTMLAAYSFDPRLIWDASAKNDRNSSSPSRGMP